MFDAAYAPFIRTPGVPKSIFEIEGSRSCCIEVRGRHANFGLSCGTGLDRVVMGGGHLTTMRDAAGVAFRTLRGVSAGWMGLLHPRH